MRRRHVQTGEAMTANKVGYFLAMVSGCYFAITGDGMKMGLMWAWGSAMRAHVRLDEMRLKP